MHIHWNLSLVARSVLVLVVGTLCAAPAVGQTTRPVGEFRPFTFAILSDLHLSERKGQERLQRAMEMIRDRGDVGFVLILGDIVWDRKAEEFRPVLARAGVPVHLVYGNNDWKWIKDGSYEGAFGPRDYAFNYGGCTFVQMWDCLPKEHKENHRGQISEQQAAWLEGELKAAREGGAKHVFVSMHVPPACPKGFNKTFFMYPETEQRVYAMFEKYAVTAAFFGHLHQNDAWEHGKTKLFVNPSCCWNFISGSQKVDSSFVRLVKVEEGGISDTLVPVWLEGETFTWETLAQFYQAKTAPK